MKWASSSVWGSKHSIVPPIPPPPKVCLLPPQRIPHQIPLIKQLLFSSGIKGSEREWLISVVTITTNKHYKALAGIFKYGNQKLSTMVWGVQFAAPFFSLAFFWNTFSLAYGSSADPHLDFWLTGISGEFLKALLCFPFPAPQFSLPTEQDLFSFFMLFSVFKKASITSRTCFVFVSMLFLPGKKAGSH